MCKTFFCITSSVPHFLSEATVFTKSTQLFFYIYLNSWITTRQRRFKCLFWVGKIYIFGNIPFLLSILHLSASVLFPSSLDAFSSSSCATIEIRWPIGTTHDVISKRRTKRQQLSFPTELLRQEKKKRKETSRDLPHFMPKYVSPSSLISKLFLTKISFGRP